MNKEQIDNKITRLQELEQQKKLLQEAIDCIKDSLKQAMDDNGVETLAGNKLYCFYKDISKQVVDNDKLKADDLYNKYLKTTEYKMFKYDLIK